MSVISALRDILRPTSANSLEHEDRLTVASLLILVAHADGRVLPVETEGLRLLLAARFGLSAAHADRVLREAAEIVGLDPPTTLIDRIANDVPLDQRASLLALAYRMAAIDGVIHDFEDDLIWRTGRLLGLSDRDLSDIKASVSGDVTTGHQDG